MGIKKNIYSLCVITDNEKTHRVLRDDANTYDVVGKVPLLCKLELKRRFSPINIFFKYQSDDK